MSAELYSPVGTFSRNEDQDHTSRSGLTQTRRRYPREHHGIKNEWHALVQHQVDVNKQIVQFEKDLKQLHSQQLDQAYNLKFQQQIQQKEQELQAKRREEELMNFKIAQYQQGLVQQKQDKATMQNILADSYDTLIKDHSSQNYYDKQNKLEQEMRSLDENQRKIESEQRRRRQAKYEFENVAHDQIGKFFEKKDAEKQGHVRFRDEYNQQVNQNIQRDVLKEENYRNYFKLAAEQQKHREELHTQNVLSDHQQRQQKISSTIENRVFEAERRASAIERVQNQTRSDAKHDLKSTLLNQMGNKFDQTYSQRKLKDVEAEESAVKLQSYQQYLEEVKNQKSFGKQLYKDILDKQQREKEENLRANRMTKDEKKLNQQDLQAYKQSDYQLHSLIPGLQHSKHDFNGSPALKKVARSTLISPNKSLIAETSNKIERTNTDNLRITTEPQENQNGQINNARNGNGDYNMSTPKNNLLYPSNLMGVRASPTYITSTTNVQSTQINNKYSSPLTNLSGRKTQDPVKENIFYRPTPQNPFIMARNSQAIDSGPVKQSELPNVNTSLKLGSPRPTSLMPSANASLHNPITNPMPQATQNPYILRQLRSFPHLSSERTAQATSFGL